MEITTKNMRALLINVLLGLAAVAAVFVAIGGGWSIAKYTGILPIKKAKKAVVIDDTPISIENVRAIGELVTANYYDEAVSIIGKVEYVLEKGNSKGKDSTYIKIERVPEPGQKGKGRGRKKQETYSGPRLILIQTVHARIGVDLSQLKAESLKVSEADKSVEISLPELKCVDFITNPSNTEVFQEDGDWSLDELKEAMMPARDEIWDKMMESTKLFDTARKGAEEVITQLFQAAGYRTVKVRFASSGTPVIAMPKVE
jgi:hypothetical protein